MSASSAGLVGWRGRGSKKPQNICGSKILEKIRKNPIIPFLDAPKTLEKLEPPLLVSGAFLEALLDKFVKRKERPGRFCKLLSGLEVSDAAMVCSLEGQGINMSKQDCQSL